MDSKEIKGFCFVCAKELGIQPVNDFMNNMMSTLKEQTGMSEEEFAEATEQMAEMLGLAGEEASGESGLFSPGGAQTLNPEVMLGGAPGENGGMGGAQVREKRENVHKKKRKHIQNFCTDLTAKARRGELDNIIGREKEVQRVVQINIHPT